MAKKASKKVAKKTAVKTATAKPAAPAKITPAKEKPRTKGEIYTTIADHVGITRKQASQVFEVLGTMIAADCGKNGVGKLNVPGLMRVGVVRKPATKATTKPDPFNKGQMMTVKAKPARNVVRVRPLKALKDMVA